MEITVVVQLAKTDAAFENINIYRINQSNKNEKSCDGLKNIFQYIQNARKKTSCMNDDV